LQRLEDRSSTSVTNASQRAPPAPFSGTAARGAGAAHAMRAALADRDRPRPATASTPAEAAAKNEEVMTKPLRRVAVLGAGVMGAGIAAHCANAGLPVLLLDIVPPKISEADKKDRKKRNAFAAGAIERMLKGRPASFSHPSRARLV